MRVHAIETGRIVANKTALRGKGWSSLLRRRENFEFPAFVYIVEHPGGLIAIDTGMNTRGWSAPGPTQRFVPTPIVESVQEIGPQMEARGLNPQDVRTVVITHLDVDHVGGVGYFPQAKVLVHRPEYEFASTLRGKLRYQPKLWPSAFDPTLYDLDRDPYGPFPESTPIADEVRLVPLPGHSIAQVGAIVRTNGVALFFVADHVLRQDWLIEDREAGHLFGLGSLFYPERAVETSRRIHQFIDEVPTVVLPAHDAEAPARVAAMEPLSA